MSRVKARSRGRWATFLLAGALTQVVGVVAHAAPVLTAPGTAPSSAASPKAPADVRAWAKNKLVQARAQLSQGNFETAESLAREVARRKLTYVASEDSPEKVLRAVDHGRKNPHLLLTAARSALARKDFPRAEQYARQAEKFSSLLTFPLWADRPSAVLDDIAKARKTASVKAPAKPTPAPKTVASRPAPAKTTARTAPAPTTPAKNVPAPANGGDEARTLIRQARTAVQANKLDEAKKYTALARARKPNLGWWEDNPERLEGDIRRLEATHKKPATIVQTSAQVVVKDKNPAPKASASKGPPRNKEEAKVMLALGRKQLAEGKLDEAAQTAQRIKMLTTVSWGLFDDSPDRLSIDLEKVRAKKNHEESIRLVAAGRKLYEKGDYEAAARVAYRAQNLHGQYSIWDLGDRPSKLLADIQTAQAKARKTALPPATVVRKDTKPTLPTRPTTPTTPTGLAGITPAEPIIKPLTEPIIKPLAEPVVKPTTPAPAPADTQVASNAVPGVPGVGTTLPPALPGIGTTTPPAMPGIGQMTDAPAAPAVSATPTTPEAPAAPAAPAPDKLKAQQLVAEAQRLHRAGKLQEAQNKVLEAEKIGAAFSPDEVGPNNVYQQIAVDVRHGIDSRMRHAHDVILYGKGDLASRYRVAEDSLEQARRMAEGFGQDVHLIDRQLVQVRGLRAGKPSGTPENAMANATEPTPAPTANPALVPVAGAEERKMLEQARVELFRGEVRTARRLSEEVMIRLGKSPSPVREEALSLLRTIDVEESNQTRLASERAFDGAMAAYRRREYAQASAMIAALDLRLLKPEQQGRLREISLTPEMATGSAAAHQGRPGTTANPGAPGIVRTAATLPPVRPDSEVAKNAVEVDLPGTGSAGAGSAGTATAGKASAGDAGEGDQLSAYKARQQILMDKLKRDAIDTQREAADKFRAGQHVEALEKLSDFLERLKEEKLEPNQMAALRLPIERRRASYALMKTQSELSSGRLAARQTGMEKVKANAAAAEVKQKNIDTLMKEFNSHYKQGHYLEAEGAASRILEIDPDNTVAAGAVHIARTHRNLNASQQLRKNKAANNLAALNEADNTGDDTAAAIQNGEAFNTNRWDKIRNRSALTPIELGRPSAREKAIERQLSTPISVSFNDTPLQTVINELRDIHQINIVPDTVALADAGISLDSKISMKLDKISLKSALNLILHQVKLTHMIKDDVLQITTEDHAKGKQKTVTYSVGDLVIPIDGSEAVNSPVMTKAAQGSAAAPYTPTPFSGPNSLQGGTSVGSPLSAASGGTVVPSSSASTGGGMTSRLTRAGTQEEQLIQLITRSLSPRSWGDMGGQATIEYHPLTMSLIVNQTTDVHEQIQDLLASLRRLQDQEVAVEVRLISVTEDFFERIGVNFSMNILTDQANRRFQPALLNNAFTPNSNNFFNNFTPSRFLSGLTPAGTLTPDLGIPITNNSFLQAIPNYGGYASGGGLSLGLAFLSDIQVFLFMEAVQGDIRANVMQAPKLTMFNGQRATLDVTDQQFFVTQIQLVQVPNTGQYALVPQNQQLNTGQVSLVITPIISSDRRFVRMNLQPSLTNVVPGSLQTQFPVAVPIFTSNDNSSAGQPVLITQYIQQPAFTTVAVNTTVVVPDGGTVVMGGLKRLAESRNEFGPPILSKIPYINRLFKNTSYGRTTESLLIMVTPRIIIQEEEERIQTGFQQSAAVAP